jgi:glutaredoxin
MIILYTLPMCPHCEEAKRKLKDMGIEFSIVDCDKDMLEYLRTKTNQLSMPVLMLKDEIIDISDLQ